MAMNESSGMGEPGLASSEAGQLVMATLAAIISCTSTILNIVVLVTLASTASLRRINNSATTSLAFADLVRAVTIMPLYVALLTTDRETWPLPRAVCPVYSSLVFASVAAVVFNCALIGAERAFVIKAPLTYNRYVTRARLAAIIIFTWVVSILCGVLQSIRSADSESSTTWFVDSSRPLTTADCLMPSPLAVAVTKVFIFFIIPLMIIIISYVIIYWVVRAQMHRIIPTPCSALDVTGGTDGAQRRFSMSTATTSSGPSSAAQLAAVSQIPSTQVGDVEHDRSLHVVRHHPSPVTSQRTGGWRLAGDVICVQPCSAPDDVPQRACHVISEVSEEDSSRSGSTTPAAADSSSAQRTANTEQQGVEQSQRTDELPAVSSIRRTVSDAGLCQRASTDFGRHRHKNSIVTFNFDAAAADEEAADRTPGVSAVTRASTLPRQVRAPYRQHHPVPPAARVHRSAVSSTQQHQPAHDECLQQQQQQQQRVSVSSVQAITGGSTSTRRCLLGDNKAVRMSLIVVGAFIVCWTPSCVCYLLRTTSTDSELVSDVMWDAVSLVALAASTLDSLIYNFYSAEFRRAARSTLLSPCRRRKSLPTFN